jgi:ribonuclease-3
LQEWVQARELDLPDYKIIDRTGPDHAPVFTIELHIKNHNTIIAQGASRRQTEKEAARLMLKQIKAI